MGLLLFDADNSFNSELWLSLASNLLILTYYFPTHFNVMKIIAVTACPTGIAHTYMAADALKKEAAKRHLSIKVETQGAMGVENPLTVSDIVSADLILIASDIEIERRERFAGCKTIQVSIEEVLTNVQSVLDRYL
ncbi:putative PTS enzyme IIB component FrwB (modular protein) [Vibrio aestuarianus]|nr:putative PTS enzyme IIB component FrwB (modular protein) [Vibrio aestuarianus]